MPPILPLGLYRHNTPFGSKVKPMQELTTTSYALLGLLAVRPWSAYELTKYMQQKSSVGAIWPRTVSKLYEEPKKLVAHGLAEGKREKPGGPYPHRVSDYP